MEVGRVQGCKGQITCGEGSGRGPVAHDVAQADNAGWKLSEEFLGHGTTLNLPFENEEVPGTNVCLSVYSRVFMCYSVASVPTVRTFLR